MNFKWEYGFTIKTTLRKNALVFSANKEGLLSLANHFTALANESIPDYYCFYLDESNSLEEGSVEIIFEKIPTLSTL